MTLNMDNLAHRSALLAARMSVMMCLCLSVEKQHVEFQRPEIER